LAAPEVLIYGSDPLAAEVASSLQRAHRRFLRVDTIEAARRWLRRAQFLMLAGDPDASGTLRQVIGQIGERRRRSNLRVLLLSDSQTLVTPPGGDALTVEHVDIERSAARLLLARWPLHLGCDPLFGQTVHLVIAGRAPPADALLLHTLRLAHYSDRAPVVTLLSDEPAASQDAFMGAHPQATTFSELHFQRLGHPEFAGLPPVTGAVVCLEPSSGLDVACALARDIAAAQRVAPPILLEVGAAEPAGELSDWDGQLIPFSHRRMALAADVLLDGRGDELAQVIHEHYRDTTLAQGRDPGEEAAGRPWAELAGSYRDANRHQADHLWAKLAVTDCRAIPEEQVESFAFAPAEVERLAVIEHRRWAADRHLDGWSYAPVRDNARKHHPQLIPYAELSGPMKDLDRFAARLVPTLLARSGLGLVRMLIVGVTAGQELPADRLRPLVDQVLGRLAARYPERGLVIAAALFDGASRLLARRALERLDAGLFLLCPRPLSETLQAQPDADARRELLALVARAERRVALPGDAALRRWLDERAEIRVELGAPDPRTADSRDDGRKRVRVDAQQGLEWNFEY